MKRLSFLRGVRLDAVTTLPTGGIAVDAILSRPGVLQYQDEDGNITREFRTPQAVGDAESIASMVGATITVLHPEESRVTIDNYKTHVVGHVASARLDDSGNVVGVLHIHDRETIEAIAAEKLFDLSPGYEVDLDETPGKDETYGSFDSITTKMTYNHISLLPPGNGRQEGVTLRLDAKGLPVVDFGTTLPKRTTSVTPAEIQALIQASISEQLATLPDLVKEIVGTMKADEDEIVGPSDAEDKEEEKTDSEEEEKTDSEEEEKTDSEEEEKTDSEEEEKTDSEEEELNLDSEDALKDRVDSKVIELIREVERVTGKEADLSKSPKELLREAAKSAGLKVRADASGERILGALEAAQPEKGRFERNDAADQPEPELSSEELSRRNAIRMAQRSNGR